jgi:hypothetical protein
MDIPSLTAIEKTEVLDIVRCLSDIQYVRLPQFPLRQAANVNQTLDIKYLMKEIDEEEWGTALERVETTGERKKEVGLILQTLLHVGSEKLTQLQNATREQRTQLAKPLLEELKQVRVYTNKSLIEKGKQMGIVVPHITTDWRWSWIKKAAMKDRIEQATEVAGEVETALAPAPPPAVQPALEETIMVELDGEIVEMSFAQAQQLLT